MLIRFPLPTFAPENDTAPAAATIEVVSGPIEDDGDAQATILGLLNAYDPAPEAAAEEPEAPEEAAEAEQASSDEDGTGPEETSATGEDKGADDPAKPAIEPPQSWTADAREKFAALPAELQAFVVNRDAEQNATFNRRMNEVAEQRKVAEAAQAQAAAERQQYAQKLDPLMQALAGQLQDEFGSVDWAALAENDPAAYVQKWHGFQAKQAALQAADGQRRQIAEAESAKVQEQHRTFLAEQHKLAADKVPGWTDKEKGPQIRRQIAEYLEGEGFSKQEIGALSDARTLGVVVRAIKAAELEKQLATTKTVAEKKVPPPVQKVVKPSAAQNQTSPANERTAALMKQLSKSTRTEDQAALLASILR